MQDCTAGEQESLFGIKAHLRQVQKLTALTKKMVVHSKRHSVRVEKRRLALKDHAEEKTWGMS